MEKKHRVCLALNIGNVVTRHSLSLSVCHSLTFSLSVWLHCITHMSLVRCNPVCVVSHFSMFSWDKRFSCAWKLSWLCCTFSDWWYVREQCWKCKYYCLELNVPRWNDHVYRIESGLEIKIRRFRLVIIDYQLVLFFLGDSFCFGGELLNSCWYNKLIFIFYINFFN